MHRLHGATAARLTPDQKVGSLNLSVVIFCKWGVGCASPLADHLAEAWGGLRAHLIYAAPSRRVATAQASGRWSHLEACAREQEVPHEFEPRLLDSESRVLIVTPRDQVKFDEEEMHS